MLNLTLKITFIQVSLSALRPMTCILTTLLSGTAPATVRWTIANVTMLRRQWVDDLINKQNSNNDESTCISLQQLIPSVNHDLIYQLYSGISWHSLTYDM